MEVVSAVAVNNTESPVQIDVAVEVIVAPLRHGPAKVCLEQNKDAIKKSPAITFILEELFLTE